MNRKELIEEFDNYGATKEALAEFKKLAPEKMEKEIVAQKKIYEKFQDDKKHYMEVISLDQYKRLCKEYAINYDPDRSQWFDVCSAVEMQKFRNKMSDSKTNLETDPGEIDMDVSEARYRLEKLKAEDPQLEDFETQNTIISLENVIKRAYGLAEKPLILTDNDLETLLTLDNWELGKNVDEFLDTVQKPALKDSYKTRFQDLISLRNLNFESERREKERLHHITEEYQRLRDIPEKTINQDGKLFINEEFNSWVQEIQEFFTDLKFKIKSYTSRQAEVPDMLLEIKDDIETIMDKEL